MKRFILFFSLILILAAVSYAQVTNPAIEIDPDVADLIINGGILGFSVTMLTQLIKTKLKIAGGLVFAVSLVVSLVSTAFYFFTIAPPLTLGKELGYGIVVWAVFNGWYKFKTRPPVFPS